MVHCITISFSPSLRRKSTLPRTVRCFLIAELLYQWGKAAKRERCSVDRGTWFIDEAEVRGASYPGLNREADLNSRHKHLVNDVDHTIGGFHISLNNSCIIYQNILSFADINR